MKAIDMAESKTVAVYDRNNALEYVEGLMSVDHLVAFELSVEEINIEDKRTDGKINLYTITSYHDLTKKKE